MYKEKNISSWLQNDNLVCYGQRESVNTFSDVFFSLSQYSYFYSYSCL